MTELIRQYAIRLPDGNLLAEPEHAPTWKRLLSSTPEPRTAVFDDEDAAARTLEQMRETARLFGVTNLGAYVVPRVVAIGPWGDVDITPSIDAVERHANGAT